MSYAKGEWTKKGPSVHIRRDKDGDYAIICNGQIIAEVFNQTDKTIFQNAQANADRIIKCVNSHDGLVEALKDIMKGNKEDPGMKGRWYIRSSNTVEQLNKAQQALNKATGHNPRKE